MSTTGRITDLRSCLHDAGRCRNTVGCSASYRYLVTHSKTETYGQVASHHSLVHSHFLHGNPRDHRSRLRTDLHRPGLNAGCRSASSRAYAASLMERFPQPTARSSVRAVKSHRRDPSPGSRAAFRHVSATACSSAGFAGVAAVSVDEVAQFVREYGRPLVTRIGQISLPRAL